MLGAGRRCLKGAAIVALAGRAVADLAFDHFSGIGAVMCAFGPLCEPLRVTGLAERGALVLGFVGGDFRDRVCAVMTIFVKRRNGEQPLRTVARRREDDHQQQQSSNVTRHYPHTPFARSIVGNRLEEVDSDQRLPLPFAGAESARRTGMLRGQDLPSTAHPATAISARFLSRMTEGGGENHS